MAKLPGVFKMVPPGHGQKGCARVPEVVRTHVDDFNLSRVALKTLAPVLVVGLAPGLAVFGPGKDPAHRPAADRNSPLFDIRGDGIDPAGSLGADSPGRSLIPARSCHRRGYEKGIERLGHVDR